MHIPDGMLSNATVAATGATSAGFVGYAVAWVRKHVDQRRVVLMAVLAALIFALQMLNFPVAGGTSGHFAGGALAGIMLGPWPAVIVMTTVLLVQALIFADGGVLALGANILNLGVIAPFVGFGIWHVALRLRDSFWPKVAGAFVAGWVACVVSALAAAFEIWVSGNAQFALVMGAMGFWHALIGIGEGVVTAGIVAYVLRVRPELLGASQSAHSYRRVALGLATVALLAVALSFFASSLPDGLEYVYFEQGVGQELADQATVPGPIPDYVVPGVSNEVLAGILAGLVGVIVVGVILYGLASGIRAGRDKPADSAG